MNRIKEFRLVLISLMLIGFVGWLPQSPAWAGNLDPWKVVEVKGIAEYQNDESGWKPLRVGAVLDAGSRVRTGHGGRVVMNRPGDSVAVSPNSRFRIPHQRGKARGTHFFQSLGTLLFKVKTRPEDPFHVKTPHLAAVIKGTTFTVSANANDAALHVSEGVVEVVSNNTGGTVLVHPGQTAVVDMARGGKIDMTGAGGKGTGTKSESTGQPAGKSNIIPKDMAGPKVDVTSLTGGLVKGQANAPRGKGRGANPNSESGGDVNGIGNATKSNAGLGSAVAGSNGVGAGLSGGFAGQPGRAARSGLGGGGNGNNGIGNGNNGGGNGNNGGGNGNNGGGNGNNGGGNGNNG